MAIVGQQLTAPETGWKRFDNADSNISYLGSGWNDDPSYSAYNGARRTNTATTPGYSIQFNFTGTNLRVIGILSTNWSNNLNISVDGITESFTQNGAVTSQVLNYQKLNLINSEHSVVITNTGSGYWGLDAIDIDDKGELKPYSLIAAPTNLTANAGDSQVNLSWTAASNTTGYIVKRSTTAGGPYTTVATNEPGTNYLDTTVTNGTTYYYVVTAIDSASNESANSNEASATPEAASRHALLRVTMNDSSEREYQLSTTEIDGFINWVKGHVSTDSNCYMLNKIEVLQNSKEYLMFEKIISFEVMEFTK